MSKPLKVEFLDMESVQRELELWEEYPGIATPEWLNELAKAIWHHAYLAGDSDQYGGHVNGTTRNPFMGHLEQLAYYDGIQLADLDD